MLINIINIIANKKDIDGVNLCPKDSYKTSEIVITVISGYSTRT